MVMLTVKGTKHADEFTYECTTKATCEEVVPKIVHIQNKRISVRNQLASATELLPSARVAVAMEGRPETDKTLAAEWEACLEEVRAELKNVRLAIADDRYDGHWRRIRDFAVKVFPNECSHKDDTPASEHEAAVSQLYQLYENPDIDEEYRLMIYHCRCILDAQWRIHDMLDTKKDISLWFNGKEMAKDATIGSLCSNNEKSRITVKVAYSGGAAPSLEPRLGYDQQRELRTIFATKAEERKQLEESEMHALIKQRYAGNPGAAIGAIASATVPSARSSAPTLKGGKVTETVLEGK